MTTWQPVAPAARYQTLDLLRGFALFGVLIINLLDFFRISLFDVILHFHTHPGALNHAVDMVMAELVEFKAFELFSLTFGMGVAVQTERAQERGVLAEGFLARRFAILLVFGLLHMTLLANLDILTLYAVCGFFLIPFLRLPSAVLSLLGLAAIILPSPLPFGPAVPSHAVMSAHVIEATRVYQQGGFLSIIPFRWHETTALIVPLVLGAAQRTFGLMLLGIAVWRAGIVRNPARFRKPLQLLCLLAGTVGLINTTSEVLTSSKMPAYHVPHALGFFGASVPLAFAYASALILWRRSPRADRLLAPVAAAGQMALTNYLTQTLIFSFVFYGYGLGLFGHLAPAPAAAIGLSLYLAQLWFSGWWLSRYRFGPFEWVWRSLTYLRRQPMRRVSASS